MWLRRPWRCEDDREDVISRDGTIVFNYLQQHPEDFDLAAVPSPVEEGATNGTDPWGITDGAVEG